MKKITGKMWSYTTNFILKNILFNLALAFAIVALVYVKDGLTIWAMLSISFAASWGVLLIVSHIIWASMSRGERALWLAIRRHGKDIIAITDSEITKKGQKDMLEILSDTDAGLEIQMIINGTGTFINLFVGIKWIHFARKFHNHENEFTYHLDK